MKQKPLMKKISLFVSLLTLSGSLFIVVPAFAQQAANNNQPSLLSMVPPGAPAQGFADLADRLLPAVVNISTTQVVKERRMMIPDMPQFPPGSPFEEFFKDFFENQVPGGGRVVPRKSTSLGSGFVIDAEGYIVTNNHVISEADEIKVIFHDNTELSAEVVGRDSKLDLALLKVNAGKKLTPLQFGDSDLARVGDWVFAIGNPFGLGGTVTAGIVSARARDINAGPYDDFIQTDASINRGNSGGPLFNLKGEVIGINTAIFSPSGGSVGIGFSIPSALAKPVVEQLRKFGKTKRGWLGVRIQGVTPEIAESLGLKGEARGALVAGVTPKGPAESANIQPGDIILKFDGKDVTDMRRLPRIVADTPIGQTSDVVLLRKGREMTLKVKVGQLDEAEDQELASDNNKTNRDKDREATGSKVAGMSLAAISAQLRQRFNVPDAIKTGLVVTAVDSDSNASELGIRPGDVIVEAGQEAVKTPQDLSQKIGQAKSERRKSLLILLSRGEDLRFVALKLDEK